jgi:hypothetical protein
MNSNNKITEKRSYFPPIVEKIVLDNEISLALESSPPVGPDEGANLSPGYLIDDPFKTNMG